MYFEDKIRSLTPHHEKMTVLQRSRQMSWIASSVMPKTLALGQASSTDFQESLPASRVPSVLLLRPQRSKKDFR